MPRGGRRQGKPGANYLNRSDLQQGARLPVTTAPSQGYGQRVAQERAQQAIPMGTPATPAPAPTGGPEMAAALPGLTSPTQYPGEPITAGLASGAGPGPEALPLRQPEDDTLLALKAMYAKFPTPEIAELIEMLQ